MERDQHSGTRNCHLIPVEYSEDFESMELNGWASYPPCQDTAYNPYVYTGKIQPHDDTICFVVMEEVHWNEDQFLGGVKLLDLFLDRNFSLAFRYFLKTISTTVNLEIYLPLATGERLVYIIEDLLLNRWVDVNRV